MKLMHANGPTVRFHRKLPRVVLGCVFAFIGLLELPSVWTASGRLGLQIFSGAISLVAGVFAVRAFRSSTLLIGADQVVVRTLVRRRRWPLKQIRGAELRTGTVGLYTRCFPVIRLNADREYECRELNTSISRSHELAPIIQAINKIAHTPGTEPS